MKHYHICMTVAGSDPSGGAGIQADVKVFTTLGCYAQAVVTSLTVQNTQGVKQSKAVDADFIYAQMAAVMDDCMPRVVKIGIVPTAEAAEAIATALEKYKPACTLFDPVMVSSSGLPLVDEAAVCAFRSRLMPLCTLITPNLPEARVLLKAHDLLSESMAQRLSEMSKGAAVLVKGGHREGNPIDVLYDGTWHDYEAQRVVTRNTHGTGCTLSSAIAAYVALGKSLPEAVAAAKVYLTEALRLGADYSAGQGSGPLYLLPR